MLTVAFIVSLTNPDVFAILAVGSLSLNIASESENPESVKVDQASVCTDTPILPRSVSVIRLLTKLFWTTAAVVVVIGFLLVYVYQTTQNEPEFYQLVMQRPASELEEAGDQFESRIIEMQNSLQDHNEWSSILQEEEINGWLAVDCPTKFPELIPPRVSQPRVQILDSEIKLAFRYQTSRFSAVVTFAGDIFVAEDSGEIAIRIKQAKTGIIPIPIARLADRTTEHLCKSGIDVTWTQIENDPVALLHIPDDKLRFADQAIRIESIVCGNQQLEFVGSSIAAEQTESD